MWGYLCCWIFKNPHFCKEREGSDTCGGAGFDLSSWEEVRMGRCGVTWLDLLEPLLPAS